MDIDRELSFPSRPEPSRDKSPLLRAEMFELEEIKRHFDESVDNISRQFTVADQLVRQGEEEYAQEIWRSQLMFLDSAVDFYIHELSKYGVLKMFNGEWAKTERYKNFTLTMNEAEEGINNPESRQWLVDYLDKKLGKDAYMSYSAIKDQLNLVGLSLQEIADGAFFVQGATDKTQDQMKNWLNRLFFRRNRIAHQSDRESKDAQRAPITRQDVEDFLEQVIKIVDAIQACAERMN